MKLKEASHFFGVPHKVLLHLKEKGLLHDPLEELELSNLSFMRYVWKDKLVMRAAMLKWSKKKRLRFCEQAELTKPESYAFNRFMNASANKKKIYLKQVAQEICFYYKLPAPLASNIAKRMRWKAYRTKNKALASASLPQIG